MAEHVVCPQCNQAADNATSRLVQDACGHRKCRLCLLKDEVDCKACKQEEEVDAGAAAAAADDDEPVKCEETEIICNNNVYTLPSHVILQNEVYTCKVCDKSFTLEDDVKSHLNCAETSKATYFKCEICEGVFPHRSSLLSHMQIHKLLKCERCDKTFSHKSRLNRHRTTHLLNKPFVCQECGNSFKNRENLRTHSYIHQNNKAYKCTECNASFSHPSNLRRHQHRHSKEKTHMCDQCGKRFKLKWALTVHRRAHSKVKPNQCDTCGRTFTHIKDLHRHELIHLDVKEFTCGICETSFKRKDNLHRHTRNAHPNKKAVIIKNKKKQPMSKSNKTAIVDTPNAINVITASPALSHKKSEQSRSIPVINAPLKLAFKTSAFKSHYNIHRDYVEPNVKEEAENIYEKILMPSAPTRPTSIITSVVKEDIDDPIDGNRLEPLAPLHYETSFENNPHAIIKNIKFKLPAKYTKIRKDISNESIPDLLLGDRGDEKTYTELKSVIVNTNDLRWNRGTS